MRFPDNPPHDMPGGKDVDDRPVADTTTSEAPATSAAPTTSEAPATSAAPATSVAPVATETDDTALSATGETSWTARKRPSAE